MQSPVIKGLQYMINESRGERWSSDLRNFKESLGEVNDILHLAHFIDAVLHSLHVFCTRTIKHAFDAGNVVLGPLFHPCNPEVVDNGAESNAGGGAENNAGDNAGANAKDNTLTQRRMQEMTQMTQEITHDTTQDMTQGTTWGQRKARAEDNVGADTEDNVGNNTRDDTMMTQETMKGAGVTTGVEVRTRPVGCQRKLRQQCPSVPLSSKLHALQMP